MNLIKYVPKIEGHYNSPMALQPGGEGRRVALFLGCLAGEQ